MWGTHAPDPWGETCPQPTEGTHSDVVEGHLAGDIVEQEQGWKGRGRGVAPLQGCAPDGLPHPRRTPNPPWASL